MKKKKFIFSLLFQLISINNFIENNTKTTLYYFTIHSPNKEKYHKRKITTKFVYREKKFLPPKTEPNNKIII
jgi:hypothetical protein